MTPRAALGLLGAALAAVAGVGVSGASFGGHAQNASSFSTAGDWLAPVVTLVEPAAALLTNDTTPALSGAAGTAAGDSATVTVRLWAGAAATGTPVQTRTATRAGAAWATTATALADGQYTARAEQGDAGGNLGLSTANTFRVDATRPRGADVAAIDGGGTAGRAQSGDRLEFSWTEGIVPSSISAGWDGSPLAVRVRFFDGNANDRLSVLDAAGADTINVDGGDATAGGVQLRGNFVSATVTFAATMALSADRTRATVTLGAPDVPGNVRAVPAGAANMRWAVSAGTRDGAGNPIATTTVTEAVGDVDF